MPLSSEMVKLNCPKGWFQSDGFQFTRLGLVNEEKAPRQRAKEVLSTS